MTDLKRLIMASKFYAYRKGEAGFLAGLCVLAAACVYTLAVPEGVVPRGRTAGGAELVFIRSVSVTSLVCIGILILDIVWAMVRRSPVVELMEERIVVRRPLRRPQSIPIGNIVDVEARLGTDDGLVVPKRIRLHLWRGRPVWLPGTSEGTRLVAELSALMQTHGPKDSSDFWS